jgi:Protein of unknown function (DUF3108)
LIRIQSSVAMKAGLILIASLCFIAAMARPQQREKGAVAAPKASSTPAAPAHEQIEIVAPSVTRPRPDYQFPLGETYVYGAEWRVFNAGIATLRMEKAGQENRIVATANAAGTISLLYHVQDRLESFFGPSDFCSHNTSRHIEEGFRRVESSITFDYQHGKALLDHKNIKKKESKHEEHDIPACVTDMLSSVYYVASLPLLPGKTYNFPINDGGATLTVLAHVEGREQVKTPAGTFKTIRVQPEAASGALRDKGKIWVWYSDDAARIPVQMRARMSWGTLTFLLLRVDKK